MDTTWLIFGAVLLTSRWWWVLLSQLLRDLLSVGGSEDDDPVELVRPSGVRADAPGVLREAPLNRRLAFRGVQQRVAARRRWEAGFGRRGL